MPALTAGVTAPDFTLPTLQGGSFSLADALKRGPVVLAFFKITCPVCQYAFPFIERIHKAYGDKVTVIGVSQNPAPDTKMFVKEYGITFPVALDDTNKFPVSNAYGLTNVPTTFFITPAGEIEVSSVGWARNEMEDIARRAAADAAGKPIFRPGEEVADFRAG